MFAISRSDGLDCHFASISSPAICPKASVSFVQIQRSNAFQYGYREFTDIKPIGSMYGIYANIGGILMVNVTIYSSTMDPSWERVSNCDQMYHSIIGILNGTPNEARKGTRRQFCGLNPRKVMVVIAGSNMFFCFSQLQLP